MARGNGINVGMGQSGVASVVGYLNGIAVNMNTDWYISSVIEYAHSVMKDEFNKWMDAVARTSPNEFAHVYEWPHTFGAYEETVGNPTARLWKQTLSGRGRNRVASFAFTASRVPTPVDPILTTPGKTGKSVKEGVHIFVWKAPVMEYNMEVTVEPKIAKMLAYVSREATGAGTDSGVQHIDNEKMDNTGIVFSNGPVNFTAGGVVVRGRPFTNSFLFWWKEMSQEAFTTKVLPNIEKNLIDEDAFGKAIKKGNAEDRSMTLTAQPSRHTSSQLEAEQMAKAVLEAKANNYIEAARARRDIKYGEEGWEE